MATELLVKIKQWKIQWDRRHLEIENRTGTRPKKCKKEYYVISFCCNVETKIILSDTITAK